IEQYVSWVEGLLLAEDGLGVRECLEQDESYRDRAALTALLEVLQAMRDSELVLGARAALSYPEFISELQSGVDGAAYEPDDPSERAQPRIYAANMNTTRGVPYVA